MNSCEGVVVNLVFQNGGFKVFSFFDNFGCEVGGVSVVLGAVWTQLYSSTAALLYNYNYCVFTTNPLLNIGATLVVNSARLLRGARIFAS